mmetsp:Transcript_109732/g.321215  ORF Transcript_109732/g.321215 Transcript_109732/m.321215 type:complete len:210 (-) Transcript_109732:1713-2342(-)
MGTTPGTILARRRWGLRSASSALRRTGLCGSGRLSCRSASRPSRSTRWRSGPWPSTPRRPASWPAPRTSSCASGPSRRRRPGRRTSPWPPSTAPCRGRTARGAPWHWSLCGRGPPTSRSSSAKGRARRSSSSAATGKRRSRRGSRGGSRERRPNCRRRQEVKGRSSRPPRRAMMTHMQPMNFQSCPRIAPQERHWPWHGARQQARPSLG